METEDLRTKSEISQINKSIQNFFSTRQKWINPEKTQIPEELRDICNSLKRFFCDKRWYCGGDIPCELLYTQDNFHLLNNIALIDAVDLAYSKIAEGIKKNKKLAKTPYEKGVETQITLKIIYECHTKNILQIHVGGLLLLYFMLCEKVDML